MITLFFDHALSRRLRRVKAAIEVQSKSGDYKKITYRADIFLGDQCIIAHLLCFRDQWRSIATFEMAPPHGWHIRGRLARSPHTAVLLLMNLSMGDDSNHSSTTAGINRVYRVKPNQRQAYLNQLDIRVMYGNVCGR